MKVVNKPVQNYIESFNLSVLVGHCNRGRMFVGDYCWNSPKKSILSSSVMIVCQLRVLGKQEYSIVGWNGSDRLEFVQHARLMEWDGRLEAGEYWCNTCGVRMQGVLVGETHAQVKLVSWEW